MRAASTPSAAADASGAAQFVVMNGPDDPLEWGGVLTIAVKGTLTGDVADPNQWQVWLNGVGLHVATVFIQSGAAAEGATRFSLVLARPAFATTPLNSADADVTAAMIRRLAPARWKTNPVAVAVTFAGHPLSPSDPTAKPAHNIVGFRVASTLRIGCCVAIVALLLGALGYAWMRTGAFRDENPALPYQERLFSLGRVQLAFWSVLVVGGYLFLYLTTGQFNGLLNSTASILLGISAATTVLSGVASAPAPTAAPPAAPPPAPAARQVHVNWLVDILSDAQGMNLHRLQMVIWTAVFGLIFVSQLLNQFQFPVFDGTAYVLMGISSTTYVWFKRNEP